MSRISRDIVVTVLRISPLRIRESVEKKNLIVDIRTYFGSLYRLPNHKHSDIFISNGQIAL